MIKKLLIIITISAFMVRVVNSNYPPLLWDEASIGYNAYSILKTARDEYGQILPIVFKSFGDYKPGLYIYLVVPFMAVFGLSELSVRLPSIIIGSLLPLLLYILITTLNSKAKKLGIIAAILLTFNPWNIHFSRGAWETNILIFELLLGSIIFLKNKYLASAVIFGVSLYTYQASKLLTPFMVLNLFWYKKLLPVEFIVVMGIFIVPVVFGMVFGQDSNRLKVMNLMTYHRPETETNIIKQESNNIDYQLFYSHPIYFSRNFFMRYFNFYSTKFLIFEGDWNTMRHSAPYTGVILYPSLIFLIIGLLIAIKQPIHHRFFIFWLLFAPIPAALSLDIIQAVRGLNLSIPIIYFTALGLSSIVNKKIIYITVISYLGSFIYYSDLYYNHLTKIKAEQSLVGYKQAINYIQDNSPGRQVIITNFYGQAYIYYLFYNKYSPSIYQKQSNLITNGVDTGTVEKIDDIQFKTPDITQIKNSTNTVAIIAYDEIIRQGYNPNDFIKISPLFYAYQN